MWGAETTMTRMAQGEPVEVGAEIKFFGSTKASGKMDEPSPAPSAFR